MNTLATNFASTDRSASAERATLSNSAADYGITLLRLALGIMFLSHGATKIFVFTLPGTAAFFSSIGFPGFFAYIVGPAEFLAGIALIAGFRTRLISALTLPILIGASTVHFGNGWMFSAPNGGWEYPVYLIALALAQALLGGGAFAFDRLSRKSA